LCARVTTNLQAAVGEPKAKSPDGELTYRHAAAAIVARRLNARGAQIEFKVAR